MSFDLIAVFTIVVIAFFWIVYSFVFKKKNGCSSCNSSDCNKREK
ncbi:MAG: FeoB-associated Cys-rich membrane protein [Desulfovibrionaceae bacterium]